VSADSLAVATAAAEAMWKNDRACQALAMELVAVDLGVAEMTMTVQAQMVNGHGICHGGYLFTLADSAFAYACNSRNLVTVAAGARIDFLQPAKLNDRLLARASVVHQGKRTGIYDVVVTNEEGVCIAQFRGNSATIGDEIVRLDSTGIAHD
jgi:acyl-CoA thioesterase